MCVYYKYSMCWVVVVLEVAVFNVGVELTGVGSLGRLHDFICEVLCGILSTVVNWVNR
jgi:hypothetical protein